jgi:PAS domain S-box-containing protein
MQPPSPDADAELRRELQTMKRQLDRLQAAENVLRESEARFRSIIEASPDAMMVADLEGNLVIVNHQAANLLGYQSTRELMDTGRHIWDFVVSAEHQRAQDNRRRTQEIGLTINQEMTLIRRDGSHFPAEISSSLVRGSNGVPIGIASIWRDITDRKAAERALRESEARYRTLVDAFPDVITVTDYEGRALYASPSLERQTGLTLADFEQRRQQRRFIHPDDWEDYSRAVRDFIQSDERVSAPIQNRAFDKWGRLHWYSGILAKIEWEGQPALQTISRDITTQMEAAETRLELALEKERRATLRTLIDNITHDIKSPLTVITTNLHILTGFLRATDSRQQKPVERIRRQIDILQAFIQDLLTTARLDGSAELTLMPVYVGEMLHTIYDEFEPLISEKGLAFQMEIEEPLPSLSSDKRLLRRALTNLVENAIHYTPAGGRVWVRAGHEGDDIWLEVRDTGIGIGPEELPHVFERFYRSEVARQVSSVGSGLGLAIVKRVIEEHGGTIAVESEVGEGTTFRVRLPFRFRG